MQTFDEFGGPGGWPKVDMGLGWMDNGGGFREGDFL